MSSTNAALEDIDFGVLPPEGIEIPGFHDHLARIRETTGVARIWNRRDWPAYAITRYEDVKAALLDQETFSPRATQEALTFPFIGRNLLGLEGRDHARHRSDQ